MTLKPKLPQPQGKEDLVPPLEYTIDAELPSMIVEQIDLFMSMASNTYACGGEALLTFLGLNAEGQPFMIDVRQLPKQLVRPMIMAFADAHNLVALITVSEGWSLPEDVSQRWANGQRDGVKQISEHPRAFEVFMISVETLIGTWAGRLILPCEAGEYDRRPSEPMAITKATAVGGTYNNLLKQNRGELPLQEQITLDLMNKVGKWKQETLGDTIARKEQELNEAKEG